MEHDIQEKRAGSVRDGPGCMGMSNFMASAMMRNRLPPSIGPSNWASLPGYRHIYGYGDNEILVGKAIAACATKFSCHKIWHPPQQDRSQRARC